MKTHPLETMKRPRCRLCGKPLSKYTSTIWENVKMPIGTVLLAGHQPPTTSLGTEKPLTEDAIVVSVRRAGIGSTSVLWATGIWRGRFGREADSLFCGKTCGYGFGLLMARTRPRK